MFAVLAEEDSRLQPIPERFRFSDENPLTLEPYAQNKFGDLPPYVEDVITGVVGLSQAEWDALVDTGEAYTVVGLFRYYSLAPFLRSVSTRGVNGPKSACPDCWGTLAACDNDGSVTGTVGRAFLCYCAV